jgi:diguanylate cyclase (GGDEF)-like protein/PAS domain S-box-containing protein
VNDGRSPEGAVGIRSLFDEQGAKAFRALYHAAFDAILLVDAANGEIFDGNLAAQKLLDYGAEQIAGLKFDDVLVHDETKTSGERKDLTTGQIVSEERFRTQGGQVIPVEVSVSRVAVEGRVFLQLIARDISERHEAEQRIRSLARFPEENPSPIIRVSMDGPVIYANPAARTLLSQQGGKLYIPEAWRAAVDKAIEEGAPRTIELAHRGQEFLVAVTPVPAAGYANVYASDITDRKRAEASLTLAGKMIESTSDAVLVTNQANEIIDVNQAFTLITGHELDEVRGKNPGVLKSGRHGPEFYREMWQALDQEGHWRGEIWDRRKNGEVYPKLITINVLYGEEGQVTHYVAVFSDISEIKATREELERLAHYDPLTGLPNRALFMDRLEQIIRQCTRNNALAALLFLDLDRFKNVNDTLGHRAGDELLLQVSRRLMRSVRTSDTVARLGGDEFTIVLPRLTGAADAAIVARKVISAFKEPIHLSGQDIFVSASAGVTICPTDGDDVDTLLMNADTAMYHAKSAGRDTFKFFSEDMNRDSLERLRLDTDLRRGLEQDELFLHFQPRVDLRTGAVVGAEALVRWDHPRRGMISPGVFIPLAEESGLIVPVGYMVLEKACEQARAWRESGLGDLRMAVNLSPRQFRERDLVGRIATIVTKTGWDRELLEVEITEGALMEDTAAAARTLIRLKRMGLEVSVDDFGTGYSSLRYLKKFPLDILKIDQSFVRDLPDDQDDAAITSAIVSLARTLKLVVIAEGVETVEQLRFLTGLGCDQMQGYLVSKPLSGEEFERRLRAGDFKLPD